MITVAVFAETVLLFQKCALCPLGLGISRYLFEIFLILHMLRILGCILDVLSIKSRDSGSWVDLVKDVGVFF